MDTAGLERRARLGVILLGARSVAIQLVALVGNVQLYRILPPEEFGIFAIVQFAIALFALFGDAGLAAALIQKQAEPSDRELSSIWTLQLAVGATALALLAAFAPSIVAIWPSMPPSSAMLLRCLALAFLLTLLRVVPTVILERKLSYGRLAILDVLLNVGFYVPAVLLAGRGLGALALGLATVVQATLGVVGVFALQPWRPRLLLDKQLLRPILKFGLAFQAKHLFGFGTNAISPVVGGVLGQAALGQLGWAQTTGFFPLRLAQIVSRVGFPLFSRLQADRAALARAVERSLHVCAVGTFLFIALVFGLGEPLVRILFSERWVVALPLLGIYSAAIGIGFLTPVLMPALDGIGRPGINTRLAALSMLLVWLLVPVGAMVDGVRGFALAYALVVAIGNVVIVMVVRRLLPEVRVLGRLLRPALAAACASALAREFVQSHIAGPWSLIGSGLLVAAAFTALLLAVDRSALGDLRTLLRSRDRST